jgi:hypothetical protein
LLNFCREITDAVKKPRRVSFIATLITSDRISAARLDGRAAFFLWRWFCLQRRLRLSPGVARERVRQL